MNALAITELLMSRGGSLPPLGSNTNAYGSILEPNPSTSSTQLRRPPPQTHEHHQTAASTTTTGRLTTASNIWGVPEESTFMETGENGSDDELEKIERGEHNNGGNDLPPSAFNV